MANTPDPRRERELLKSAREGKVREDLLRAAKEAREYEESLNTTGGKVANRLRAKLAARKVEEAKKPKDASVSEEEKKKEKEKADADAAKVAEYIFAVSVTMIDRATLERSDANPVALEIYDRIVEECASLRSVPSWKLSTPSLVKDVDFYPGKPYTVACGGVMIENEHEWTPAPRNVYASSLRVWSTEDPNREQREEDEREKREHKPKYEETAISVLTSMDGFRSELPVRIAPRYDTTNDPARDATTWEWAQGSEKQFDFETDSPVRATITAGYVLNREKLYGESIRDLDITDECPYISSQLGVVVCRAATIFGKNTSQPHRLVAVVNARHCVAHFVAVNPVPLGAKRLISRAFGRLVIGTRTCNEGEGQSTKLGCILQPLDRMFVMPYEMYQISLKHLRSTAITYSDKLVKIGDLVIKTAHKREEKKKKKDGHTDDTNRKPTRLNAVTTYVYFESCPSLLLLKRVENINGWLGVRLQLGTEGYIISAEKWTDKVEEVKAYCTALLEDRNSDVLKIDDNGFVDIDHLADLMEKDLASSTKK